MIKKYFLQFIFLFSVQFTVAQTSGLNTFSDSLYQAFLVQYGAENGGGESWTLQINEFCASNNSILTDEDGEYTDWLELHNYGDMAIDLTGLYLSDDPNVPEKFEIPFSDLIDMTIPAGGYFIIYLDDDELAGANHANFTLDMSGEYLSLSSTDLSLIDEIEFGPQVADHSMGRPFGFLTWSLFPSPTPGEENTANGLNGLLEKPIASVASGFFNSSFEVSLTHPTPEVTIRYTLDGSIPNATSPIYASPIVIDTSSVLNATASLDDWVTSRANHNTYLFDDGFNLDVVSLSVTPSEFWGPGGIYSYPYNGLERQGHFCFFKADGTFEFDMPLGIRIHAPDSRDQKSLRLYARSEYGESKFNYPFFEERPYDDFNRLILRNSGNDGVEISHTALRDPLISNLYGSINSEYGYSAYKPVHVFLNGDYWGIYNLRERQDSDYLKSLYDYDADEVDFLERTAGAPGTKDQFSGTWEDFDLLEQTAVDLDLSVTENYDFIADWMNIENFVDYQLTEIYIINQDWLSNNMKFWKPLDDSRKWEWIIWDTDWGLGTYYPNYPHGYPDWDALGFALSNWGGWTSDVETELLQNLTDNADFVEYFATRGADLLNSKLKSETIIERLDEMSALIEPDLDRQFEKWGSSYMNWSDDVDYMHEFIEDRPAFFREKFITRYDLGEEFTITLDANPPEAGYIEVNTIFTDEIPWNGIYYDSLDVRIKAVANPGYVFQEWEEISDPNNELFVDLDADSLFTAIFALVSNEAIPVINEIHYHPSDLLDAGEWVEIFNPGPGELNLSYWTIEDSENIHVIPDGAVISENGFAILCEDTALFQSIHPEVEFISTQLTFNLSNEGESIFLKNIDGITMDFVNYGISSPWPFLANGSGPSLELHSPELDNNFGGNWFTNIFDGGSPGEVNQLSIDVNNHTNITNLTCYPNPFTEFVIVDVEKDIEPNVVLSVTDLTGRLVKTLSPTQVNGKLRFIWNGDNNQGSNCPDGIYFLDISSGQFFGTQKVVLRR